MRERERERERERRDCIHVCLYAHGSIHKEMMSILLDTQYTSHHTTFLLCPAACVHRVIWTLQFPLWVHGYSVTCQAHCSARQQKQPSLRRNTMIGAITHTVMYQFQITSHMMVSLYNQPTHTPRQHNS